MRTSGVLLILLMMTSVISMSGAGMTTDNTNSSAAVPISSCTTIDSPGHYRLTKDIINSTQKHCITISADDVVFNGQGHRIDGVDNAQEKGYEQGHATKGIRVGYSLGPVENVTIKNTVVTDWGQGMGFSYASHGKMLNNTARSNIVYGMYLGNFANDNVVRDNKAINNVDHGLFFSQRSDGNLITENYARGNGFSGIGIARSDNNTVINNTVVRNQIGIRLRNASNNTIRENTIKNSTLDGIQLLKGSTYNEIRHNTIESNRRGIWLTNNASNNHLQSNQITRSRRAGIEIQQFSNDTTAVNNTILNTAGRGILILGSTGTTLRNTTILRSGAWAIWADGSSRFEGKSLRMGAGTRLSIVARGVALAKPEYQSKPGGFKSEIVATVVVDPTGAPTRSWIRLTLLLPRNTTAEGPAFELWQNTQAWANRTEDADITSTTMTVNITQASRITLLKPKLQTQTVTASPTSSRTSPTTPPDSSQPSQSASTDAPAPGFGVLAALLAIGIGAWFRLAKYQS